jgi:predicted DNA-binding WGR domain protein
MQQLEFRRFYHTAKTKKVRYWGICVVGDEVHTQFGELHGKVQTGLDKGLVKNAGRSNEVSAEQDAHEKAERLILEKQRDGYVEMAEPPSAGTITTDTLDLTKPLPTNLCFFKPDNEMDPVAADLIAAGEYWFTRKRDGEMLVLVHPLSDDCPMIYSRTMLPSHHKEDILWEKRFPRFVEQLKRLPPGTVLLGEAVQDGENDGRWSHVARVLKAKTDKAIKLQDELGHLHFVVWDIAYLGGESLRKLPYRDRMELLDELLNVMSYDAETDTFDDVYFHAPETYGALEILDAHEELMAQGLIGKSVFGHFRSDESLRAMACEVALAYGWEGWVAVDPNATFETEFWNFRGKADRPFQSTKVKPYFEDDFVAIWHPDGADTEGRPRGTRGTGKRLGKVGAVSLYQFNEMGDLVYIGDCGGGIDDKLVDVLSDPAIYPLCLQVEYETRQYESLGGSSNALQFPRVLCVRGDKAPEECINVRL